MKFRTLPAVSALLLVILLFTGAASADHGYMHAGRIPMAAKFSVQVRFDADGVPHVETNYPFTATGAEEMGLTYSRSSGEEAVALLYRHDTGETIVRVRDDSLAGEDGLAEVYRGMRNGLFRQDDRVYINTTHFDERTDWFLVYSLAEKRYVEYSEKTLGESLNDMQDGGVTKTVYYNSRDEIEYSRMLKTKNGADLIIEYEPAGEIMFAYVSRSGEGVWNYDPSTGLFSGKKVTELGFEENDLAAEPLAAESEQTRQAEIRARAQGEIAAAKVSVRLFGGLLSGVIIGILLYSMIRRRRKEKAERSGGGADGAGRESGSAEETPSAAEPPERKYMSSGK